MLEGMSRGEKKGFITERRFRKGMERKRDEGRFPSWLGFVMSTESAEDARGIDMWAYTDVGKIPLQIKSSEYGRNEHISKHDRYHIPSVAVPFNKPFDEIFEQTIQIISAERDKIIQRKTQLEGALKEISERGSKDVPPQK